MSDFSKVKAALKRGALVAAANWPVVIVQFVGETILNFLLAVPLLGGAALVALLVGGQVGELWSGDLWELLAETTATLASYPAALASFLFAVMVVWLGRSIVMFLLKAGTVAVLVAGERAAGPIEQAPLALGSFTRAAQFSIARFLDGASRLAARFAILWAGLLLVYAASGALYLLCAIAAFSVLDGSPFPASWTAAAAVGSALLFLWILVVNLLYVLLQIVVAVDDCGVREAVARVGRFLRHSLQEVMIVFGLLFVVVVAATIVSVLAVGGLGLIAFVPLVGVAALPLQALAWLVRGLVFQHLGLAALVAYLSFYRAFSLPVTAEEAAPGARLAES